jgi:hypothetical protein
MTIDSATGLIEWTPTVLQDGLHDVSVRVTDSAGALDNQIFQIDVTLVNEAPVITTTAVTSATAGQSYTYDVDATDPDLGDTQTWSLTTSPAGMTIDAATGVIDWTPTMAQLGDQPVSVTVTDFHGLTATQDFTVTVSAAPGALFFSNVTNDATVPGVDGPYNNANIYAYDGAAYSAIVYFIDTMGFQANIDGLQMVDADTFYVSFSNTTRTVPGIGTVEDEDVLLYDAGVWSVYFDGTANGLTNNGHDIDAFSIEGGTLYFSTVGNANVGGLGSADDGDIYSWNGASFARVFDASAAGLANNADIDGLTVKGGVYYVSFNRDAGTSVPGLGTVQDEAVVTFDGVNWALYFAGPGLDATDGQDLDAVDVP